MLVRYTPAGVGTVIVAHGLGGNNDLSARYGGVAFDQGFLYLSAGALFGRIGSDDILNYLKVDGLSSGADFADFPSPALAFDGGGDLYAIHNSSGITDGIVKLTADQITTSLSSPVTASLFATLIDPEGLAVEPLVATVPEPASAALLALGLGGLFSRRRRKAR